MFIYLVIRYGCVIYSSRSFHVAQSALDQARECFPGYDSLYIRRVSDSKFTDVDNIIRVSEEVCDYANS